MQREIANVMAACGLSAIRYVSFPPVVFETPAPKPLAEAAPALPDPVLTPEPAPVALQAEPVPPPVHAPPMVQAAAQADITPPPVPERVPESVPEPVTAWAEPPPIPHTAPRRPAPGRGGLRRIAELAEAAAEGYPAPAPATPRDARAPWPDAGTEEAALTAPAAHHGPAPGAAPPSFSLLQDLAGELRPRRVRAKTSRRSANTSA